ncbi:hypothetical protein MMC16_003492 [Acarospora aff. strigata]|nr:hypothetical protein [Acarospora aff. strigata]
MPPWALSPVVPPNLEGEKAMSPSRSMNVYPEIKTCGIPSQAFRFLDLPGELRNRIYRILLHKETRKRLCVAEYSKTAGTELDPYKGWMRWQYNNLEPAILAACHAVHDEAAAIMYGTQPFYVHIRSTGHETVWTADRQGTRCLIARRYLRLIRSFKLYIELSYRCCGTSAIRKTVFVLWSNIETFCSMLKDNTSLVRMEISFKNRLLRTDSKLDIEEEGQEALDPFMTLRDVRDVIVTGDVQPLYALQLKEVMKSRTTIPSSILAP